MGTVRAMDEASSDTLRRHLAAVRASPHNLVSSRALGELEDRHLGESVALAELLPPGPARLVDVGSGGGFPGFVIAVLRPDLDVTLVEATGKKARFLADTAVDLGVEVDVVHARIEEAARGPLADRFDLATARAVAPLARLVPWVLPSLKPGGRLFAVKGARWVEELDAARDVIAAAGATVEVLAFTRPLVVTIARPRT
ncbi:MAG: 16S rRNA (guanine(527)-N(7))-methyltransferase RsmG [Nitriliruptorales bacterium]